MSDIAIRVENLSKRYRIGQREPYRALRDVLARGLTAPFRATASAFRRSPSATANPRASNNNIWALKDVSFEVKKGEVIGIIGRNGAGKSTLLKILSRIAEPTEGYAEIHGRVGSLLEVGTGFHPELTGRENIYLNGAILGMKKHEIDRKFDEIVDFAEIEKFIDTPVKYYSSGMYVRLAFAVAAHLEPEILLVDEVLAVGDAAFQKKCLGKMGDVAKEGRTVLFVSHNMPMIRVLCERAILINQGTLVIDGHTSQTIQKYLIDEKRRNNCIVDLLTFPRSAGNQLSILEAWIENTQGNPVFEVLMGSSVKICFRFKLTRALVNPGFGFGIENSDGQRIFSLSNYLVNSNTIEKLLEGIAVCYIPELPLLPATYLISLSIVEDHRWVDYIEHALTLTVVPNDVFGTGKIPESSQGLVYVRGTVYAE